MTEDDNIVTVSAIPDAEPAPVPETPVESAPDAPKADEPTQEVETPETPEEAPEDQPKPKKQGISQRFSEITREKYEAIDRAARAEAELAALRRQNAERAAQPAKPSAPESFDPFNQEQVESTIDQRVEAKLQEVLAKREADEKAATAAKRYNDFASKVTDENEGAIRFLRDTSYPVSQGMAEFVFDSPDGLAVADYLGSNPSEAARIASLSPALCGAELARLEMKLKAPSSPPPKVTKAPAPVPTVGTRAAAGTKNPDDMTQAEFEAWYETAHPKRRRA